MIMQYIKSLIIKLPQYSLDEARTRYSFLSIIIMFIIYSFFGWVWEVCLHFFIDGMFVNRGVLRGPWLPIYGTGGILSLLALRRFIDRPLLLFFLAMLLCTVLEYVTGWFLLTHLGYRWWDYSSDYVLQLHGHISLLAALFFGVACLSGVYIISPALNKRLGKLSYTVKIIVCAVLLLLFVVDTSLSIWNPNMPAGIMPADKGKTHVISQARFDKGTH